MLNMQPPQDVHPVRLSMHVPAPPLHIPQYSACNGGLIQFNYQMRGGLECGEGGLKKSRSTSCFHVCCRRLYISPHLIRAPITCFPPVKYKSSKHEWVVRMQAPGEETWDWYCAALFAETVLSLNKGSILFFLETHRPNPKLSCKSYCS